MGLSESGDSLDAGILALLRKKSTASEGVRLFYEVHGGPLIQSLRNKFRTFEESQIEDLLTDTVVKLIANQTASAKELLGKKRVGTPIRPWAFTVARNQGLDVLRRERGRDAFLEIMDPEDLQGFAHAEASAPSADATAWLDRFQRCMDKLSPQQRAVMHEELSGLRTSDREIAEELGTTEPAIRQARNRGRNRIRTCMKRGKE